MPKYVKNDITGGKFGRLIALRFVPDTTKFSKFWCRCDCGKEKLIMAQVLIGGLTQSCGCLIKENHPVKHGQSGSKRTKTYNSWAGMMDRCEWGGHPSYEVYGKAGIRVDPDWHSFESFYRDMGDRPDGTSIDRINNDLGYFNGNCRWATRLEQALNKTKTLKVKFNGEVIPVYMLVESFGLSHSAVRSRAFRRSGDYVAALNSFGINATADLRGVKL